MSEETMAQRMAASLGVSVESMRAAMASAKEHLAPPEGSLCGEEEALAAGSFEEVPPVEAGTTFDGFLSDLRGRGRSAQRVTAETLDLVGAWHHAWVRGFIQGANEAYVGKGQPPLTAREKDTVRFFATSFESALRSLLDRVRAMERGGR